MLEYRAHTHCARFSLYFSIRIVCVAKKRLAFVEITKIIILFSGGRIHSIHMVNVVLICVQRKHNKHND